MYPREKLDPAADCHRGRPRSRGLSREPGRSGCYAGLTARSRLIAISPQCLHVQATWSGSRFIITGQPHVCGGHPRSPSESTTNACSSARSAVGLQSGPLPSHTNILPASLESQNSLHLTNGLGFGLLEDRHGLGAPRGHMGPPAVTCAAKKRSWFHAAVRSGPGSDNAIRRVLKEPAGERWTFAAAVGGWIADRGRGAGSPP